MTSIKCLKIASISSVFLIGLKWLSLGYLPEFLEVWKTFARASTASIGISTNDNFKLFFEDVKHHSLYFEYYNVDVNYIMIVFKLDEDGSSIYRNFRRGEYSKFPEKYKNIFQNSFEAPLNSAYNVIIKNPLLRHKLEQDLDIQLPINAELDDKPYLNEEIFRYDNN